MRAAVLLLLLAGSAAQAGPRSNPGSVPWNRILDQPGGWYRGPPARPFFCGRDGVVKYSLAEIEKERRVGYAWYVETPRRLLERYPRWRARWTPDRDVLGGETLPSGPR